MSYSSEKVKLWRLRTKERIVKSFGGVCAICGYSRCLDGFDLHHLDANSKEFGLSGARTSPKAWAKIVKELRKCILLCCRCHREYHAGVTEIPEGAKRFDESYAEYKEVKPIFSDRTCQLCDKRLRVNQAMYCSPACSAKYRSQIDWDQYDLLEMSKTLNNTEISKIIGCSNSYISRRIKNLKNS